MAYRAKDVYRGRQKSHKTAKIIIASVILLLAVTIGGFYLLKSWCVYDAEGRATIVFPFTQEAQKEPSDPENSPK